MANIKQKVIKIPLVTERSKPTIEIETDIAVKSVLIDTGAHMAIRFSDEETFLAEFPQAKDTNYI